MNGFDASQDRADTGSLPFRNETLEPAATRCVRHRTEEPPMTGLHESPLPGPAQQKATKNLAYLMHYADNLRHYIKKVSVTILQLSPSEEQFQYL